MNGTCFHRFSCAHCQCEHAIAIAKVDAAFDLYDWQALWDMPCSSCRSTLKHSISLDKPPADADLLAIWAYEADYHFLEQDEALWLAEMSLFPQLVALLDEAAISPLKIGVVVEALVVLLYDQLVNDAGKIGALQAQQAENVYVLLPELIRRKDVILSNKIWISDAVRDLTFPLLFGDFREMDLHYDALENYVYARFQRVLDPTAWRYPYFQTAYANGVKMRDGNPIFSAQRRRDGLILKIIVDEDISDQIFLATSFDEDKMHSYIIDMPIYFTAIDTIFQKYKVD